MCHVIRPSASAGKNKSLFYTPLFVLVMVMRHVAGVNWLLKPGILFTEKANAVLTDKCTPENVYLVCKHSTVGNRDEKKQQLYFQSQASKITLLKNREKKEERERDVSIQACPYFP